MDPTVIVAAFGALGTIISAFLVYRVQVVQRTVNGHTRALEKRLRELQDDLVATSLRVPATPPGPGVIIKGTLSQDVTEAQGASPTAIGDAPLSY